MSSLFNEEQSRLMIKRIHSLTPMSEAQWGGMSVSQMLAHLQLPFELARDRIDIKPMRLMSFLFGRSAKRKLVADDRPFEKHMPTFKEARIKDARQFETEKSKLIRLIEEFQQGGPVAISQKPHPFFGKMTPQDWDILQYKHVDHHLRQFGA